MAGSLSACLETAAAHAAAGRESEARRFFDEACRLAVQGSSLDPVERACAVLTYANHVLQEEGSWPLLLGKGPDELLLFALETARGAKQRSRALEGQLLFLRSKALFARPSKDASCLDEAMQARFEAGEALREASVETLKWPARDARSLLERLKKEDEATSTQPLELKALCARLRKEGLGGGAEVEEEVGGLFAQWSGSSPEGDDVLSLAEFLQNFLEIAGKLDRAVDAEPCSAPCEGGLPAGSSELEKELVGLVSRQGAGGWEAKAAVLRSKSLQGPDGGELNAASVEALWKSLAPTLNKAIKADEPMACGHSCSTCPTRHDCQVHDALKDIEDL